MNKPFQRVGSKSNAQAGKDFELAAQKSLLSMGLKLERDVNIPVGVGDKKKEHSFDLSLIHI